MVVHLIIPPNPKENPPMATRKQVQAAKRNIRKAIAANRRRKRR